MKNRLILRHMVDERLISHNGYRKPQILLIGAGGTGSLVLSCLGRLNHVLKKLGHRGFHVSVFDGDKVSANNVGRQNFSVSDIGLNKAEVITKRVNIFFGHNWDAIPRMFTAHIANQGHKVELVITAVDSAKERIKISKMKGLSLYWLDAGNSKDKGQVILGTMQKIKQPKGSFKGYIPTVVDLFPGIEEEDKKTEQGPSCSSMEESIRRQQPTINSWMATATMQILFECFSKGILKTHGVFINARTLTMRPLAIDPENWKSLGYKKALKTK